MIKNSKVSQRSVLHECCKLQGHKNNLIKFVCACHDCPYRLQKACAPCVIKLHGKHVEQMQEIDEFDGIINENLKKATQLIKESEQLFKLLENPFKDFFDYELTPGPGQYEHAGDIDPKGLYYCSKFVDTKSTVFIIAKRELTKIRALSPGSRAYRLPSEFGYYVNHYEKPGK